MEPASTNLCPNCERLQAQVDALGGQVDALQAVVAQLQEQLACARKDSSTSAKPPSSDIVKPPKPSSATGQTPRRIGGQPGHPKHERAAFPPEQITLLAEHLLHGCPDCGGPLRRNGDFARVVQQVDVQPPVLTIEQHTCPEYWCSHCAKPYKADLPNHVETGGLLGPRLTTLIAYLKGACHASFSTIRKFLRDVVGVTVSRGQLAKVIAKVSAALAQPYDELLGRLPDESVLNVDETGHKDKGELMWTWCFKAELYTLFKIDPTRSADVLIEVLGEEFDGVLGCDCFSAYRRYMRECDVRVQFCLAHLIREVKFLCTLPDEATRRYGARLREALRELFGVIHRREHMSAKEFAWQLRLARANVLGWARHEVPASQAGQRLAARLEKYGASYFEFITTPGIEPTNNTAEQAIRFVVIDRHITQGTRGATGQRFCERMWTVMATCSQQGRSVWEYVGAAVRALFHKEEAPSLLPGAS
jgi:transposase